jgi:hypothetical protein
MHLPWIYDDGGRAAAGFRGDAGDCVTRAIAIATGLDYRRVYDDLAERAAATGDPRSARNGVWPKVYKPYLSDFGWRWWPTMAIGSGCTVHLTDELLDVVGVPGAPVIARLSRHLTAVVGGAIRDRSDPSRDGTRCVYGYWREEAWLR